MRPSAEFIAHNREPIVAVEVGVRNGDNAIDLLNGLNIKTLYLVDPYHEYNDSGFVQDVPLQSRHYVNMFNNMQEFITKTVLVTRTSGFASQLFKDGFFDYVYIDADHSYKEVIKDLKYWYPKLKSGGCFSGHDINMTDVKLAVDEFTKALGLTYMIGDIDWYFIKP